MKDSLHVGGGRTWKWSDEPLNHLGYKGSEGLVHPCFSGLMSLGMGEAEGCAGKYDARIVVDPVDCLFLDAEDYSGGAF